MGILLWGSMVVLLALTPLLWLLIEEAHVRQWIEDAAGAASGKRVTIGGPVTWSFSLEPRILLTRVAVTESPERGFSDLAKAGTIEVSIALLPLLHGAVVIPSLAISDLEVRLTQEAGDGTGGTRDSEADRVEARSSQPAVQIHTIVLHRAAAIVQGSSSPEGERIVIGEARLDAVPDQPVRLVASGEFRSMPVTLHATGGSLSDLIAGRSEEWPFSFTVQIPETSLNAEGTIGLPLGTSRLAAQFTITGGRLNALNSLLAVAWPALGPYTCSGQVKLTDGHVSASDVTVTLGSSDLSGDLSVQYTGRPRLSAHFASQRIDAKDFFPHDGVAGSGRHDAAPDDGRRVAEWLKAWDLDVTMTARTIVVGEQTLGSVRLEAGLEAGVLHVAVPAAHVLGMLVHGHAEIDAGRRVPALSLELTARGLDPGLLVASISDDVIGIADVIVTAEAHGLSRDEWLNSAALSLRTGRTTFLFRDPLSKQDVRLSLDEGGGSLDRTGGRMRLSGRYGFRSFRLEAETGPLSALSSKRAWPIRVALQMAQARLLVHGGIRLPLSRESVILNIDSRGRSFSEVASSFPAVGPFRLSGRVIGDGRQSWAGNMAWQIGGSDGKGRFDVAVQGDEVVLTAALTSGTVRVEDFRVPVQGDKPAGHAISGGASPETPVPPKNLTAHVTWRIDRVHADRLSMNQLLLEVSAEQGRLEGSGSARHAHGNMAASLVLDGAVELPTLCVRVSAHDLDYGALLREWKLTDRVAGTAEVSFDLTTEGRRIEDLASRIAFDLTAKTVTWRLSTARDGLMPISLSRATLSSHVQKPVMLALEGAVRNVPVSITVTTLPPNGLLAAPSHLPWTLVLRAPDVALEAQGRAGFQVARGSADFHVGLSGSSASSLLVLFSKETQGLPPFHVDGDVSVRDQKLALSDFRARVGKSDVGGGLRIAWDGPRPWLAGGFASEFIELKILETLSPPAESESAAGKPLLRTGGEQAKKAAATAQSVGEEVVDFVSPVQLPHLKHAGSGQRVIPDWVLPVQSLQSADVDFHWTVKRLSMPPVLLEDAVAMVTVKDGKLTLGPFEFGHHGAMTAGRLTLDGAQAVPHVGIELTTANLDYGGILKAFRMTNMVEGSADITLVAEGRGRSLREVAGSANGSLDIVAGPAKIASRFVELWASNLMTAMLSQAWHREPFTRYHCAAADIEIENGEMRTDSLLIEATDHAVAAAGSLNLGTEELDVVVTPKPKDLAVLSLATPIRLTGPLAAPKASTNVESIAASKAWQVLDVADPIGLALLVPRVMVDESRGAGASADNPCRVALRRGGREALSTQQAVRAGFTWFGNLWQNAASRER